MPTRHNISRAAEVFQGSANLAGYQANKNGIQWTPTYRWRPTGTRAIAFTAAIAAGAVSATLSAGWAGATGIYTLTLSTGQSLLANLFNGQTTCLFYNPAYPLGDYIPEVVLAAATAAAYVTGQPPLAGVANALSVSAAIAAGGSAVLVAAPVSGFGAVPIIDVPRNVVGAWTTASTIKVTGTDIYGQTMTETQTGTTFTGKKAFWTVTSITSTAAITAATFGVGNVLGLPFRASSGDLEQPMFNDLADVGTYTPPDLTQPSTSTGDVRGTYAPGGTLTGAKFLVAEVKVMDATTQVGSFGRPQQ